jgi:hypothetical protein
VANTATRSETEVTKITSRLTFYYKWIFPILWFGFIAFFMVSSFLDKRNEPEPMFYLVPAVMALFGFVLMKKLVWDLMDEVYDCGDSLLIRNRGEEERINLSNIINVNVSSNTNPRRITLRLDKPSRLGNEIVFRSRGSVSPLRKEQDR